MARTLRLPPELAEVIRGLHPQIKRKLRHALRAILADPACGKALKEELAGLRSLRVGRFRAIYRPSGRVVDLIAFGPRERIYEETHRLLGRHRDVTS
jgi:mRNA interferase RelE/StbE